MDLLIVESPAKAKTISKYVGDAYEVRASVGHIRDLPKNNKQAIDIEAGFVPHYEIVKGKEHVIEELKELSEEASHALNDICTPITVPEGIDRREEFYYRIMKEAVGFIGSLVICNDRRAPDVADLLEQSSNGHDEKSESASQLLRGLVSQYHLDQKYLQTQQLNGYGSVIPALDRYHSIALAEIVGHQLGEQLFAALIAEEVSRAELRKLFYHSFEGTSARRSYYAMMQQLEASGFSRNRSLRQVIEAA